MSKELNDHLLRLLREAADILHRYEAELDREWKRIGEALGKRNARATDVFSTLCAFVQHRWLPYGGGHSADGHLERIAAFHPEMIIFSLNLMENTVHQVLKAHAQAAAALHPAVRYLFFKWNEWLLYEVNEQSFKTGGDSAWKKESLWKDAVILFNEWILRAQTFEESAAHICFGFSYFLPFSRCALFQFVNQESTAIGLYGHGVDNRQIQRLRVELDSIPMLKESVGKLKAEVHEFRHFRPIYVPRASEQFPKAYVEPFDLASLVIVPVYVPTEGRMIGGVVLDRGPGRFFSIDRRLFPALMKFGQSAGELLLKWIEAPKKEAGAMVESLSPREIEVLKLLADGASTLEAACQLYLSEFTVRDYISSALRKLHAKNRTEAVAKALRLGLIG
ncbi:response regulator transcription factor [Geobacillus sp. TFV-3]|uniref:helix-turn-helix domain-containing protein n=1 Tax=Geobacillus sp. TFV-3 TaxID=1897059 RepID=UPI00135B94DE|nr:response regulator transcription factor [Geobacillus sp. TFV-3]KAF0996363.1 Spore germination protein GerE [Geobacillus sp. TFV-3]